MFLITFPVWSIPLIILGIVCINGLFVLYTMKYNKKVMLDAKAPLPGYLIQIQTMFEKQQLMITKALEEISPDVASKIESVKQLVFEVDKDKFTENSKTIYQSGTQLVEYYNTLSDEEKNKLPNLKALAENWDDMLLTIGTIRRKYNNVYLFFEDLKQKFFTKRQVRKLKCDNIVPLIIIQAEKDYFEKLKKLEEAKALEQSATEDTLDTETKEEINTEKENTN